MGYRQEKSMIAGTDPVKKAKNEKVDSREIPEPSIKEQKEIRNNNQSLKDQCAKNGGTWDTKTGTCKYKK